MTLSDLRRSWASGYTHPETLKRATAVFMGPCQGKYCAPLVGQIIAELDGERAGQATPAQRRPTARPPLYPVRLGDLAAENAKRAEDTSHADRADSQGAA